MNIEIDSIILNPKAEIDADHDWGYEVRAINTDDYCGKLLVYTNDAKSSLHYHKIKDETFFCLAGEVSLEIIGRGILVLWPGDSEHILAGTQHQMQALTERAILLEVSTHHDDTDTYRVE